MTKCIGIAISAVWLMLAQAATAAPTAGPTESVETAIVQVLSILNSGETNRAPVADRSAQVRRIARELFDFDEISRHALGRHWQSLSPVEQAEFVTLFRDLLERSYMSHLDGYSGEKITFVGETVDGDLATVRSKVVTKRGTEIPLEYRVHARDGRWLVYDVQVGGMSFVSSYRSQFDRVIRTEGYAALRGRLHKKNLDTALAERRPEGL
jgi:phospholipid transport system substrate-binding protein